MRQVYLGWDSREQRAYEVAEVSIATRASSPVAVNPLRLDVLKRAGMMWRPTRDGVQRGSLWDEVSRAPMSTEFAMTRFLIPRMQQRGWALFVDCDIVCLADIEELFALADDRYALMCVKHGDLPQGGTKMDGQIQTTYSRKNWSSVVLWNCAHEAHQRLDEKIINTWPGRRLHNFCWLDDEEIGALPAEWNWLVNVEPKPSHPKIAHFTLGTPDLKGMKPSEHDHIWWEAEKLLLPPRAA